MSATGTSAASKASATARSASASRCTKAGAHEGTQLPGRPAKPDSADSKLASARKQPAREAPAPGTTPPRTLPVDPGKNSSPKPKDSGRNASSQSRTRGSSGSASRETSRPGSRERSRQPSQQQGRPGPSKPASHRSADNNTSGAAYPDFEAEIRKRLEEVVNNRPQPKGIDFTVDAEEPPTELSDAEVLHLLQREEEERPSQVLTKALIASRCGIHQVDGEPESVREQRLQRMTHLRLDRQRIAEVDPSALADLPKLTNIYLQHNRLAAVPVVSSVLALRFLVLSHNRISEVHGLADLPSLMFLDISYNKIRLLDSRQLPESIRFLEMEGNQCSDGAEGDSLTIELMAVLPNLKSIDGMEVSSSDRAAARQAFFGAPLPVESGPSSESEAESEDEAGEGRAGVGQQEDPPEADAAEHSVKGIPRGGDQPPPGCDQADSSEGTGASGVDKLTSVVSYLEDIEKGQLRELHDLRTASLRQSMTNLQHIKEKITRQLARPSSARRSASAAAELPTALAAPTTSARKSSQPTQTSDLHEEARRLGQLMEQMMNPANDPAALQSRILEDVRGSLRDQADQMVEAARQRLSEERRRDLEVSKSIKALRSSQAEMVSVSRPGTAASRRPSTPPQRGMSDTRSPPAGIDGSQPPRPSSAGLKRPGTPSRSLLAAERLYIRSSSSGSAPEDGNDGTNT